LSRHRCKRGNLYENVTVPSVACNRMIETNVGSQLGRVADAATVAVKGRHVKLCVVRVCEKERENESNPSNNGEGWFD
jgi:hypothetical protein